MIYRTVFILYAMILTLTGLTLTFIWLHAGRIGLLHNDLIPSLKRLILIQMIVSPIIFLVSILISLINVDIAQYFWLAIIPLNIIVERKHRII